MRLEQCAESLRKNNFEVYCAVDPFQAARIFQDEIIKKIKIATASWGDSLTLRATGILDMLKNDPKIEYIETFDSSIAREELIERRRQALLVDLFLTGTNAVTEDGMLVNLDMVGNRVGGITFGPLHVVLVIGRNKIVTDLEAAMQRIKNHAAPLNAMRHEGLKTPCMKTSFCMDCSSPDRICNTWTITEKSFPKNRIKIILVNQDLGI
jgi:L-lactate utilization protein LutB